MRPNYSLNKIFIEILKDSFTHGIVSYICWLIPVSCTITSLAWHELPYIKPIYSVLGIYGIIELFTIILLLRIIWVSIGRYKSVLMNMSLKTDPTRLSHYLYDCISEINKAKEVDSPEDRSYRLRSFCNKTKILFDKISGSHCCVSIKVAYEEKYVERVTELFTMKVSNMICDDLSADRHIQDYDEIEHFISRNTAFINIINRLEKSNLPFYVGKNLRTDDNYQTSSSLCAEKEGKIYNRDLPYDSEIVSPIYEKLDNNKFIFRGFLCVDCEAAEGFNAKGIEVQYMKILSDCLYALIHLMKQDKK